jgi:DNA-directed RNA polymerase specialized sigma24 family protein
MPSISESTMIGRSFVLRSRSRRRCRGSEPVGEVDAARWRGLCSQKLKRLSLGDPSEEGLPGPEARYETKEAIALAFIVGLQHLPPQQRAVLVLRDVLGYRAGEVAEMLDTSEPSVNNLLRRARAAFESPLPAAGRERAPLPNSKLEREIVGRFAETVENGDIDKMVFGLPRTLR